MCVGYFADSPRRGALATPSSVLLSDVSSNDSGGTGGGGSASGGGARSMFSTPSPTVDDGDLFTPMLDMNFPISDSFDLQPAPAGGAGGTPQSGPGMGSGSSPGVSGAIKSSSAVSRTASRSLGRSRSSDTGGGGGRSMLMNSEGVGVNPVPVSMALGQANAQNFPPSNASLGLPPAVSVPMSMQGVGGAMQTTRGGGGSRGGVRSPHDDDPLKMEPRNGFGNLSTSSGNAEAYRGDFSSSGVHTRTRGARASHMQREQQTYGDGGGSAQQAQGAAMMGSQQFGGGVRNGRSRGAGKRSYSPDIGRCAAWYCNALH